MVLLADDIHLVHAAQRGDTDAFEVLARRHQAAAYRVALRMLGNQADAEDATQEALLQAWRALPTFRAQGAFTTWLYRIVVNRCLTMLASRRSAELIVETEPDRGPGPAEIAEADHRFGALKVAITRLTPEQRAPLILREFEGLSYAEIGDVLDLTLESVKGRLHRARLVLVEAMRTWR